MYDDELDKQNIKLTNEELREFNGFETFSDSECEETIDSLIKLTIIMYNLIEEEI